ncbi:MAG: hypothetical protein MJ171_08405 [Clostridia bacterium]|nr:hypothetical protein [Clostridia bacterium]
MDMNTEKMHTLWLRYVSELEKNPKLTKATEDLKRELFEYYSEKGLEMNENAPLIMMEVSFISGFIMGQGEEKHQGLKG